MCLSCPEPPLPRASLESERDTWCVGKKELSMESTPKCGGQAPSPPAPPPLGLPLLTPHAYLLDAPPLFPLRPLIPQGLRACLRSHPTASLWDQRPALSLMAARGHAQSGKDPSRPAGMFQLSLAREALYRGQVCFSRPTRCQDFYISVRFFFFFFF